MDVNKTRRRIRAIGAIGVLAGFVYLLFSLWELAEQEPHEHAHIILYAALLLFPHSVALAYVASGARKLGVRIVEIASYLTIPALASPFIAISKPYGISELLIAIPFAIMIPGSLAAGLERRGSVRLSYVLVAYANALYLGLIALWHIYGPPPLFSIYSLSVILAYPVMLIYAVTFHSFPSTLGDKPNIPMALTAVVLLTIAVYAIPLGSLELAVLLSLLSLSFYIIGAKLVKYKQFLDKIRMKPGPGSPAYNGLKYFLDGHLYVIIIVIAISALIGYSLSANGCDKECILLAVHLYSLGFSLMHVAIHAPMMLPVILGIRHAKRFNQSPYVLLLLSTIFWPFSGAIAYMFIVLGLVAMILVFLPFRSGQRITK